MLSIKNLQVNIDAKQIIKNLSLEVKPGQVHAIMGPNGSGKSTLSNVIAGKDDYKVSGTIEFNEQDLLQLEPHERASNGIFVAFQYPVELPGVSNISFLKAALNNQLKLQNKTPLDAGEFLQLAKIKAKNLEIAEDFLYRDVNVGFSGGEKKRNEMLQMQILEPKLAILDETDSGLDVDALKIVAKSVNMLKNQDRSFVIITHYPRLLDYIKPDFVHILRFGDLIKTGDHSLAHEIEQKGYNWL